MLNRWSDRYLRTAIADFDIARSRHIQVLLVVLLATSWFGVAPRADAQVPPGVALRNPAPGFRLQQSGHALAEDD